MRSHSYYRAFLLCLLAAAGLSCGDSASGPGSTAVAVVTISVPPRNIDVGGTAQLTATAYNLAGDELIGLTFEWSSSDKTIATVSSTGVVTGVAVGSARITAQTGAVAGFADITVGPRMTTELTEKPIPRG
ncbi:MAG TPA: Ig-like domain-containing protein [Gemmatimonadaceae bacterium]